MNRLRSTLSIRAVADRFGPYAQRLQELFTAMDHAYVSVAGPYGFHCTGCEDNCCQTRFHHHTYLELFFIHHGLKKLQPEQRGAIQLRAADVCRQMEATAPGSESSRWMCPLNQNGRCLLYDCRPMICRLHGIPHAFQRPDGRRTVGTGCEVFRQRCGSRSDAVLDRTPYYAALAALEQEFRLAIGLTEKIKLTVAEMIDQLKC